VHADSPLKLRSYWTEVQQIYKQYSQIVTDKLLKSQNGDTAISFRIPGRRIKLNWPISPILTLKLVAMATTVEQSETEGHIRNLQSKTYHTVKMLWKSVRWILGFVYLSESFVLKKETRCCEPLSILNSRVTGPKFTKSTNENIARSSRMNFLKSEWRYCNPFRNARAIRMKVWIVRFCQFWP